jgi:hypothetical protein
MNKELGIEMLKVMGSFSSPTLVIWSKEPNTLSAIVNEPK